MFLLIPGVPLRSTPGFMLTHASRAPASTERLLSLGLSSKNLFIVGRGTQNQEGWRPGLCVRYRTAGAIIEAQTPYARAPGSS